MLYIDEDGFLLLGRSHDGVGGCDISSALFGRDDEGCFASDGGEDIAIKRTALQMKFGWVRDFLYFRFFSVHSFVKPVFLVFIDHDHEVAFFAGNVKAGKCFQSVPLAHFDQGGGIIGKCEIAVEVVVFVQNGFQNAGYMDGTWGRQH